VGLLWLFLVLGRCVFGSAACAVFSGRWLECWVSGGDCGGFFCGCVGVVFGEFEEEVFECCLLWD